MKKIGVYLSTEPYGGGAFQYNQSIITALDRLPKDKYQIYALFHSELWMDYLKKYEFHQIKIERVRWKNILGRILFELFLLLDIDMKNIKHIYARLNYISRQIDEQHLDLVFFPSQELYPALISSKSLVSIHDLMHRYETRFPEVGQKRIYKLREFRYKNICACAEGIFVDSNLGKKHVLDSYGVQYEKKLYVLPFAPPQYLFENNEDNDTNMELPQKYIFYPAQFWAHKNHKNLILALHFLKQKGIEVNLLLVGSKKNAYDMIRQLIDKYHLNDNIKILGYVNNYQMVKLYKNARAMIMPSYFGPTNIPPLEGFSMGCPVAVSNVYGMPEMVGDAALLFDPDSIQDIASVIERLWNDDLLCEHLIEKGYQRSIIFSQKKFNMKFKESMERIISEI